MANEILNKVRTNKKVIIILALLLVATILAGYQVYKHRNDIGEITGTTRIVANEEYGISFSFAEGQDAFTLVEPPENQVGIRKAYVLMPTKSYEDYKNSETATDAPPAVSIFLLNINDIGELSSTTPVIKDTTATDTQQADRMTRLKDWAVKNNGLTQFNQAKAEPELVEIDGLKALKYETDGLYQQTVYLATYKENVYMLVSQYNEKSDATATAFESILQSVSFN